MENSDDEAVRFVRCPRCKRLLKEPRGDRVYKCGGCGIRRAKIRTSSTGEVASATSASRSGPPPRARGTIHLAPRSMSPTPPDGARRSRHRATSRAMGTKSQREAGDLVSARWHGSGGFASTSSTTDSDDTTGMDDQGTDSGSSSALDDTRGSSGFVRISSTPDDTRAGGQGADSRSHRESIDSLSEDLVSEQLRLLRLPRAAAQLRFSDRKEPAPKSAQTATAQSARDGEDDAASAAAAGGKVPELQAENLRRAAKEAQQRLPPRNHCRPVLKGAPFIVCSSCLKLVQVPAEFAVSTDTVRKLRCGSCWAVLSYSYRDPAWKKPCHGSIDQLSTDMSELQVDAAPLLLEVLQELGAPRGGGKKVKEIQPEGTQKGLGRIIAPSWQDVLHSSSGLPTPTIYQVEKSRPSFYKDVQAWFAMKNQYERGLYHHACVQQVGLKLLCRNDIKQMIMEKLLLDRTGGSNCSVICINAGSGHGKTSLLHALYNDKLLTDTFDKRIWIQLSDRVDMSTLFRKIVEGAMNDHCSVTNLGCLQEMVKEEFVDKKFLLFLDDADIEDQQFWNTTLEVLNASAKGSAVIMATRSSTVYTFMDITAQSYILNPLSEENNLMLLQQYAAMGTDIQSNPVLLMVAKRFISMFGTNPLNLKAIGGLLCHADSISFEMDKLERSVVPLQLCHDVLPVHLKNSLLES